MLTAARRSAVLAIMIAAAQGHAQPPGRSLPSRFTVPTILVNRDAAVTSDLLAWKDLLQSDVNALVSGGLSMLPEASRIRFAKRDASEMPSSAAIADRWRQENAIQVITAAGLRRGGGATVLEGSIYLGDLAGSLAARSVILPPTIDAASYRNSRDIVRATLLYALAMDAGAYKPAACMLLYRAGQVSTDLAKRQVTMGGLSAAIDQRAGALRCTVVR